MNLRGTAAELAVAQGLLRRGYEVAAPLDPCCAYDLLFPVDGVWKTVQVKSTSSGRVWVRKRGKRDRKRAYEEGDFDYLAVVHQASGEIWLMPWAAIDDATSLTIENQCWEEFKWTS